VSVRPRGASSIAKLVAVAGALAGALAISPAAARPQETPPAPRDTADTARTDTAATTAADSLGGEARERADTIKAPLAKSELPVTPTVGAPHHWTREQLFATGAQSLLDLLDLVPGVTTFRSGWLIAPKVAAHLGDAARTRVFLDGVEITSLNPRTGGVLDLSDVQLWMLEEVTIERGADEIRIHARSWRTERTATSTRTDVATGDQNTNIFRGNFGKRFGRGQALQLAGQQLGVGGNFAGGGDELSVLARLGWAGRSGWSIDAFGARSSLNRDRRDRRDGLGSVPQLESRRTDAYLRVAYGDPDSGFWAQAIGAAQHFRESSTRRTAAPVDTVDSTRTTQQYVAALGFTRWGARISITDRVEHGEGDTRNALSARVAFDRGPLGISLFTEQRGSDFTSTEEASAVLRPVSFLALTGAVARRHGGSGDTRFTARGEVGLRLRRLWVSGGVVRQEATAVPGLVVYDSTYTGVTLPKGSAYFATLRGRVHQDLGVDVWVQRWQDSAFYRPRLQGRAEVFLDTRWLRRFPRGNFGFLGSAAYEGRSRTRFPVLVGGGPTLATEQLAPQHVGVVRVEIRIVDAVLFYQQRFGIYPRTPATLPGHIMPPQLQLYGVRWEFWN
jgi:hypothetical protein